MKGTEVTRLKQAFDMKLPSIQIILYLKYKVTLMIYKITFDSDYFFLNVQTTRTHFAEIMG